MRRSIALSLLLWAALPAAQAQQAATGAASEQLQVSDAATWVILNVHYLVLSWTDDVSPVGTTYNVYRSLDDCSRVDRFVVIASGVSTKSFLDRHVARVPYCYILTSVYGGQESAPSLPFTVQALDGTKAVTVQ